MTSETAIQAPKKSPPARASKSAGGTPSIESILQTAVQEGRSADELDKLIGLCERMQDRKAEQEFGRALARFQSECPVIKKTSTASIVSRTKGTKYSYNYAELDEIISCINPVLHKHGLSFSWDCNVSDDTLTCVCKLRHESGHRETATFQASTKQPNEGMSEMQQSAAALTFAKRQSLCEVLGIVTGEPDTDGGTPEQMQPITLKQVQQIEDLLHESDTDPAKFKKWLGVEKLSQLQANRFESACRALQDKIAKKAKGE